MTMSSSLLYITMFYLAEYLILSNFGYSRFDKTENSL